MNKPSRQQKKVWYNQHKQQQQRYNPKGKGKGNEVVSINEVKMFSSSMEDEDDPLFQFTDYLEEEQIAQIEMLEDGELADIDMDDDASFMVVHTGWHNKDDGFNVAGPSNQPFQITSFKAPF